MANLKFNLLLPLLIFFVANSLSAQHLSGDWFGILDIPGMKLEIDLRVKEEGQLYTANMVVPDQGADLPIPELAFKLPKLGILYSGLVDAGFGFIFMTHLLQDGYIVVLQDVRARFMSEGQFVDVRPYLPKKKSKTETNDNSDTYDTIDWLVNNVPGNNGRAGIYGVSYDGYYSTMALPSAHPALKAASPQAPVINWFLGDDWHHNGAFFLLDAFSFYSTIGRPRPAPTRNWPTEFEWPNQDNYRFDAEDCYGALRTYEAIEKQNPATMSNRLVIGPWFHGQWTGGDADKMGNIHWGFNTAEHYKDVERRFFRHYLHGEGALDLPEADIFVTGSNEWRSFDTWPPRNVSRQNLYFQQAGGLSFSAPTVKSNYDEYVADPMKPVPYTEDVHRQRTRAYMTDDQRFAARRPDVMVYQTEPLVEEVTLTGPLTANLFVSTSGTDADYVVKLIDVFPNTLRNYPDNEKKVPMAGYQMLVHGEVMRGRFRESFESPQPFKPGKVTEVKFDIPDVAHTFKRGHRMMIQVQNSWFPLVDRNPQKFADIYQCSDSDFQKATHRVYHDSEHPSHVQVWKLEDK